MPLPSIDIELSSPQSVDGRQAAYQSLWLLVRLHHAQRQGEVVALDALRGQVSSARTLRMVVSRAFRDFKAWGLRVGWGTDAARDPRFLNAEGRSQGPFWLPAAEARRLRLRVDGQPARPADVAAFLGLSASPRRARTSAAAEAQAGAVQLQDARFWHQLAAAQQAMRQGRWAAPVQGRRDAHAPTSALAAMRQAADLALDDYQRALVTLNEALLWRRLGDDAQARKRLAALQRQRLARQVASHDYLGAMAAIVGAWCSYTARDLPQAQAQLAAMTRDAQQAPLLRHHPQVRFEWSNLWALACRSRALGLAAANAAAATQQADEAMAHFGRALASAFESHAFDAAQHVAANMGMAVWLFDRVGLGVQAAGQARGADARRHAVQWIAFSEWLCSLADGQGRSAWNAIYLMRVARGDCQPRPGLPLAEFAALRPLTPRALAEESADRLAPGLDGPATRGGWAGVAAQHLADHDAGQRRYPGLQLAGLLFEQAWFAAHDRDLRTAATALTRLRTVLPQLVPSDRAYFRDVWNDALPAELLALEPPPRRSARRAAMG